MSATPLPTERPAGLVLASAFAIVCLLNFAFCPTHYCLHAHPAFLGYSGSRVCSLHLHKMLHLESAMMLAKMSVEMNVKNENSRSVKNQTSVNVKSVNMKDGMLVKMYVNICETSTAF